MSERVLEYHDQWKGPYRMDEMDCFQMGLVTKAADEGTICICQMFDHMSALPGIIENLYQGMMEHLYQHHGQGD